MNGQDPELVLLDSTLTAGLAGQPTSAVCGTGGPGEEVIQESGSVTTLEGAAGGFRSPGVARELEFLDTTVRGQPGELVWLLYSTDASAPLTVPHFLGPLLLGSPVDIYLGQLPASGLLTPSFLMGQLPPGVESTRQFLQTMHFDGRLTFGAPSHLVLLDSGL